MEQCANEAEGLEKMFWPTWRWCRASPHFPKMTSCDLKHLSCKRVLDIQGLNKVHRQLWKMGCVSGETIPGGTGPDTPFQGSRSRL